MKTAKAGEGVRTLDIQLGKLALYQLSYTRNAHSKEPQIGIEPMTARLRIECSTTELLWRDDADEKHNRAVRSTMGTRHYRLPPSMPSRGLEPRCLSAQAPQACVSTNFTTRAAVQTAPSGPIYPAVMPAQTSNTNLQGQAPCLSGGKDPPAPHHPPIHIRGRRGSNPRPLE